MTRKSKREIEQTLDELEGPSNQNYGDVNAVEQYFSPEYPDPPRDELGDEWRRQLQPDNEKE